MAEAEHNHEEAVLKNKILYIAIGIAIAAGWLVIGGLLTKLSIKHEKGIIAVILHVVVIAIIIFYLFILRFYVCK